MLQCCQPAAPSKFLINLHLHTILCMRLLQKLQAYIKRPDFNTWKKDEPEHISKKKKKKKKNGLSEKK